MGLFSNTLGNLIGATANAAVNTAMSYVPGEVRSAASSILGSVFGGFAGTPYSSYENFSKLRKINSQLVHTDFQYEWNFRLEIEGAPDDFEFYVKDVTYGMGEFDTSEENYGAASFCWPTVDKILRVSCTMRDNVDFRNMKFLYQWYSLIFNNDGTVRLPYGENGYVKLIKVQSLNGKGEDGETTSIYGYPSSFVEITRSHENGAFMEIPVTFTQFSSIHGAA